MNPIKYPNDRSISRALLYIEHSLNEDTDAPRPEEVVFDFEVKLHPSNSFDAGVDYVHDYRKIANVLINHIDDVDVKNKISKAVESYKEIELDGEYDEDLYQSTADLITESVKTGRFDIHDLVGKQVNRDDQSLLMTFPTDLIADVYSDELPDDIITRDGKWTTSNMDYWDCSFSLLAFKNDLISIDEIKPYTEARCLAETVQGTGITPWLSKLDDDDILNLAVEMREAGALGNPPYRALRSIAKSSGFEINDGVMSKSAKHKAHDIFDNMCS